MSDQTAIALAEAGQALRDAARSHKRAASSHRRSARELMQKLTELERQCAARGIRLEIDTQPEEAE
jgi:hypothetical protein